MLRKGVAGGGGRKRGEKTQPKSRYSHIKHRQKRGGVRKRREESARSFFLSFVSRRVHVWGGGREKERGEGGGPFRSGCHPKKGERPVSDCFPLPPSSFYPKRKSWGTGGGGKGKKGGEGPARPSQLFFSFPPLTSRTFRPGKRRGEKGSSDPTQL